MPKKKLKKKIHLFISKQRIINPQQKTIIEENKKRRGDMEINILNSKKSE